MAVARYDLALIQNLAVTGVDFEEVLLTMNKGDLISGADTTRKATLLTAGTNGYHLVRDDTETTGLKWVAIDVGHTQNTDSGTTGNTFTIDSDSATGKIVIDVALNVGEDHTMTLTNAEMTADVTLTLPAVTGTVALQSYADGLFAANDAMLFKGTLGSAGTISSLPTTYNAGWTYRIITAGTYASVVCQIGDVIMAIVDRAGSGNVDADWTVMQTNIDGAVIGPASVTDGVYALFDTTSGKLLKAGSSPTAKMDTFVTAPATKTASGTLGQIAYDANYLYICTATDTWRRTTLAQW